MQTQPCTNCLPRTRLHFIEAAAGENVLHAVGHALFQVVTQSIQMLFPVLTCTKQWYIIDHDKN